MGVGYGCSKVPTQSCFVVALFFVCLLVGCRNERKMSDEETAPAESLARAGGTLQSESIPANDNLISVTGIEFNEVPIGDLDLQPAVKLPYLKMVALRGTKITDAGLAVFKDCQHLESVDLSHSLILGTGLHNLHFSFVKEINVADSKFDDRGIAGLIEVGHNLLRLNLAATAITDEGMEPLAGLRALEEIDLSRTRLSGAGLRYLPSSLKRVNLSGTPIVNASLAHLERLTSLESLNLSETNIDDDAIPHIQAMMEAQHLKVGRRRFESLNLHKTAVRDEAIELLKRSAPGLTVER
jgi:uncharacterized protein YjbI with pentapeptide repeats